MGDLVPVLNLMHFKVEFYYFARGILKNSGITSAFYYEKPTAAKNPFIIDYMQKKF